MDHVFLKRNNGLATSAEEDLCERVVAILAEIETGGERTARRYAREFDKWDGEIIVSRDELCAAADRLPQQLVDDICFAHDNIRRFAEAQRKSLGEFEIEIPPGVTAGQKHIPVASAGCYVPGGRYSHIASALMTVTTAKVAGVTHITACSPPRPGSGIDPAILYALELCGADAVLNLGGVQGVAAMAFGLFGVPMADILVGPGNQYVTEAKRLLFGRLGIDMVAGPTETMVLADSTADPMLVAWDLVGQAEHGYNSPVWLVSSERKLAEDVTRLIPELIAQLPETNAQSAEAAWRDHAEVILCADREAMALCADDYAPEHLHVQAADLDWWLARLRCYGSLFLGEETTVAFGDKCCGPNHVLPTFKAARYTGGLSVQKFMKTVTWQRATQAGIRPIAEATARISRLEGMEGHARTADIRIEKYFADAEARRVTAT